MLVTYVRYVCNFIGHSYDSAKCQNDRCVPRIPALSNRKRWAVSLLATIASTYALDAVATAAGMTLVCSGLMLGLDHLPAILFLASTYVAWGAGLRMNLKVNIELLERTGTSTNVLSKALTICWT